MSKPIAPRGPLRSTASWVDERASERGDQRIMQGFASLRAEEAYDQAARCAGCDAARKDDGREDALCEAHLAQALGMGSGWDLGAPGRKLR